VRDDGYVKCHRCGIAQHVGEQARPTARDRDKADAEHRRELALWLVGRSVVIATGGPVDRYLRGRGLRAGPDGWPPDLRQAHCKHPRGRWWPTMLGVVRSASGVIVGCHRTFITGAGPKAPVDPLRLSLGPIRGGAVRLGLRSSAIVVGEGVETALATAMQVPDAGVPWAALSAGGLASLDVPTFVEAVTIAVDHDDAGEQAARRLLKRLGRLGVRNVRCVRPRQPGHDMADTLGGAA
jgi:hypothetical protein